MLVYDAIMQSSTHDTHDMNTQHATPAPDDVNANSSSSSTSEHVNVRVDPDVSSAQYQHMAYACFVRAADAVNWDCTYSMLLTLERHAYVEYVAADDACTRARIAYEANRRVLTEASSGGPTLYEVYEAAMNQLNVENAYRVAMDLMNDRHRRLSEARRVRAMADTFVRQFDKL